MEYLAGRWAVKAFSKALGVGIGIVGFQDIEVLNNHRGLPTLRRVRLVEKIWLSISHSGEFVQASVILEENND